jgi:hypothetical protein
MNEKEFSVYWTDPDGNVQEELRWVDAKTAVDRAHHLAKGPASLLGIVQRVIITDGGDCCVFEWLRGVGVTFPKELEATLQ